VANVIRTILNSYPGSRAILVDTHGEYSSTFSGKAKIFKINDSKSPLYIPFWMMNFDELSFFLVGRKAGEEKPEDKRLRETILELKKANAARLKAGAVNPNFVTADSPIPFDIRKMWHNFNREVNATHNVADRERQNPTTEELEDEGNPQRLIPARFRPYAMGNVVPFKAKDQTMYAYEGKIHSRLKDSRYDFMFNPGKYYDATSLSGIDALFREWIDHEERLTILDLNEVPFELTDISVGLITRIVFDSMYWGRFEPYTGRNRPLLLVYEEAHSYLPKGEATSNIYGYARKAVERVYKEGRKFGVGAMVVTQRPSEISQTILAQVGTFIALRMTNSSDKSAVQAAAPNNMTSLIDLLPSLRIGEAIVVGEAIKIPTRVRIDLVEPRPGSNDPELVSSWKKTFKSSKSNYKRIATALREQKNLQRKEK
jgi:hypothetical protein